MSEQWASKERTLVQTVYAFVVGTVLIGAGVFFLPNVFQDHVVTTNEIILIGGICIVGGLVTAIPSLTMPLIHKGVKAYLAMRAGSGKRDADKSEETDG